MFGSPSFPALDPAFSQQITQPQPKKSGGMFGGGDGKFGIGQALVAALNGYLAGTPGASQGVGMNNLRMMQDAAEEKRKMALADQQYQRERQDKRSDFTFEQDYKAAHDTPDISQRIAALNQIHPGLGDTYAQNYAANGGGMMAITNPVTGQQMVPASRAPQQAPPPEAIQLLKSNPTELGPHFDEVFGPGAAAKILGGPTQPASGGFPGPQLP